MFGAMDTSMKIVIAVVAAALITGVILLGRFLTKK